MFPPRDPSLSHHCTSVKILWDSKGRLPALTPRFLISCSLMNGVSPHRSKLKASRTSRTSSVWWLWLERTPPPNPTSSPSTTSASRRSATTTRLTCKMFQSNRQHQEELSPEQGQFLPLHKVMVSFLLCKPHTHMEGSKTPCSVNSAKHIPLFTFKSDSQLQNTQ